VIAGREAFLTTPFAHIDAMPVLETERLRLRALELADADALHEVLRSGGHALLKPPAAR
jgi:RimJ/RimL family protein N-acetyltransferase